MSVDQRAIEEQTNVICPLCQNKLPDFRQDGTHNFCPHTSKDGAMINICISCKMNLLKKGWSEEDWSPMSHLQ